MHVVVLLVALAAHAIAQSNPARPPLTSDCSDWRDCRQLALGAAERGEFEAFHDLAWRAVQKGPAKDPSLMLMLARAQSLSGRPHDALVMLLRLAEMGVASDAATNEDFSRTRQLPGWPEAEARIAAMTTRTVTAAPAAPTVATPPPPAAARPTPEPAPATVSVVTLPAASTGVRFSMQPFEISGLAYDVVSSRFVMGDRLGRKLVEVDERSNKAIDLVRADSAGFLDVTAVAVDQKRGDLWVGSGAGDGTAHLHKLQLLSGRPLRAFDVAANGAPVQLADIALGPNGTVFVLDRTAPQLLMLRPGATAVEPWLRIDGQDATSVAPANDDRTAFVAHGAGISRIDLRARTSSPLAVPNGISLQRLERIRWQDNALVAIQHDEDGGRRILRLGLNARGTAIAQVTRLEATPPPGKLLFVTIADDELLYIVSEEQDSVAYRVPLK